MTMRDKLQTLLAQMRINGIAAVLDAELERSEKEATPAGELLYRLLCEEAASQRQRSLVYHLKHCLGTIRRIKLL
jgi:hypothetical protein